MSGRISIHPRCIVFFLSAKDHLAASTDHLPRGNDEHPGAMVTIPRSTGERRAAMFTIGPAKNLLPRAKDHHKPGKNEDAGRTMFGGSGIQGG